MIKRKKKKSLTGMERFNRISIPTNIILSTIVIAFALLCLLPILLVVSISFSSEASLNAHGYQFIPSEWSLDAYNIVFSQGSEIPRAFLVSVFITIVGTGLAVILQAMYAYVLSRKNYKLNSFAHIFIIIPMLFSGGTIPSYMINTNVLGLGDSLWALILPGLMSTAHIILMRTYFKGQISDSLVEAAEIDGAGQMRIFWTLVLPLSKPVLATIAIFKAIEQWNSWVPATLYIRSSELLPLQALLMEIQGNINFMLSDQGQQLSGLVDFDIPSDGIRMALVVIIVVPIALAYPFFQRYFTTGLTIGSIKG